jgi:Domain of unknown function (DUF4157)
MKLPKKPLEQARASEQYPKFRSELQPDIAPMPGDIDFRYHPHYDNQPRPDDGTLARQTWRFGVRPTNFVNQRFPTLPELSKEARERLETGVYKRPALPKRAEPLKPGETMYGRFMALQEERQGQNLELKPEINLEQKVEPEIPKLEPQKETPNLERQTKLEQRKTSVLTSFKKTSSLFSEEPKHVQKARALRTTYESRALERLEQQADAHVEGLRRPEFDANTNPLAAISEHFIAKSKQNQPTRAFERSQHITNVVRPAPSNLIRTARASGFKTSQLTGAIQRFTDPTANKAVRAGIMTGLHNSPSLSLEVQRSLEESDANLEVQRQEFLTEARAQEENSSLSERIANELNGGIPLEEGVRKQLEAHFNTDLSKVRVHTDGKAHELAKSANAIAFTTGKDIFFQTGKYDPNSSVGFELLAHETAHTIQQASGQVSPGVDSSSSLESDAKLEGQKAVGNKTNLELQVNNFNDFLLKPNLFKQSKADSGQSSQLVQRLRDVKSAIQRDRSANDTSGSQKPTGDSIYVPIDASVDTKKELMVIVLVQLGFDKRLAEAYTNENGNFKFESNTWNWVSWVKPSAEQIKAGGIWVELSKSKQQDLKTKSAQANLRFQAQGGLSVGNQKAADGFRVIVQERLYSRGEVKGQPSLVGEPALKVVPVGTEINYGFDDGEGPKFQAANWKDPRQFRWFVQNDPKTVKENIPAVFKGPNKAVWSGEDWDIPGDHIVVLEVTSPKEKLRILFTQHVGKIEDISSQNLKDADTASNYVSFRAMQELQTINLSGGGLLENVREDQRITSTGSNPASGASYTSDSNPPPEYTYSIKPTTGAVRFSWRAVPEDTQIMATKNYFGYQGQYIDNQLAYIMPGNKTQSRFVIAHPNIYNIICDEFDAKNNKIGEAQYRQVVLNPEQEAQYDQWKDYVTKGDKAMKALVAGKEIAIKSVFVNQVTAVATPINLFIGKNTKGGVTLLDLSPGAPRIEFEGKSATEALELFNEANKYPKGQIALKIPKNENGIPEIELNFKTDGKSSLESWADGIGWASIGLVAAGFVAAIIPGGQVVAGYLFLAAAAAGGVSSSLALADELKQAKPSGVNVAVDILGIASSLIGAGGTVRGIRALAKGGEVALGKAVAGKVGQYLIITDFALNGAQGIVIAASSVQQIDDIANSNMSREEKIQRIVRILAGLAINGTLLAFGAKNLGGSSSATRAVNAMSEAERELLNALPAGYRSNTTLKVNPSLESSVIRVVGDKGSFGVLKNIRIEVGSLGINKADLLLHLEALEAMRMYGNFSGRLRALRDQLKNWVKRNGKPAPMSRAWEIEQEIAKLEKMIATRASALETQKLSKAQKLAVKEEIKVFDSKLKEYNNTLSSKIRAPGTGEIAAPSTGGRVRSPIQGLYQSIDTTTSPKGWKFNDSINTSDPSGMKVIKTIVTGPNGEQGVFERAFNPKTGKAELRNAFLNDLPAWIDNSVPLVNGRGIPTVSYITMYQLRKLGADFGKITKLKMSTIQNIEAILQLEALRRQKIPLDEAILQTHSVEYAETSIIQSGQEISSAKVDLTGAWRDPIDDLMKHFEGGDLKIIAKHNDLLKKYGLKRTDLMYANYDIELSLKPLSVGNNAKPIGVSKP